MEGLPNVDKLQEVIMSRTYRRKKDKAPWWVTQECVEFNTCYGFRWKDLKGDKLKKEIAKWHSDAGWHSDYTSCPGWWNHEFHEVPFRRECRDKLKNVTLDNYEEVDIRTNFKRPHIYYW